MSGNVYWIADTHFNHKNVIEYCARPYVNTDEMNHDIIRKINNVVGNGDRLYHLGDVGFGGQDVQIEIIRQINGQKYLIAGNHDKHSRKQKFKDEFVWVRDMSSLRVDGQLFVMCHYPMITWNHMSHDAWHLHGHCHGALNPRYDHPHRIDVGWDVFGGPVDIHMIREHVRLCGDSVEEIAGTIDYHDKREE